MVGSALHQRSKDELFGECEVLRSMGAHDCRRRKVQISGIPLVVILDSEGALITTDGRAAISADTKGEDMTWKPKTFSEIFADASLLGPDGAHQRSSDLAGPVVGLYFSAHWCPPCRAFTPQLAN